jgi:GTPase SAR1 family protein
MHGYFIIIKCLNFQLCNQTHQKLKLESNFFSPTCAGKTTLRRSMARSLEKGVDAHFIPLVEIIELRKPFKCCFNDPDEWDKRTRGINIKVLVDNLDMKVSIWDLAGQEEYHAFHDMMLPNLGTQGNVCYFLLVCNPFFWDQSRRPKTPQELEDEFSYRLKFISSNTKRSSNFAPQVTIVLTNNDKRYIHQQFVVNDVPKLRTKFVDFINLSSNIHSINAHCSQEAKEVLEEVTTTCKNVLENLPKVYEICLQVQLRICQWIKEHPNQPIVSMQIFEQKIFANIPFQFQLIAPQLDQLELEKPHIAIAMFLHDAGEIIYFKNEDFVVLNLNWFCHKVMGHLIKLRRHVENTNLAKTFLNGFGEMEHLEIILGSSLKNTVDLVGLKKDEILNYLVRLMVKMDFAYEVITAGESNSQSVNRLFVPITLQFDENVAKGERRLEWTAQFSSDVKVIYIGQRLQCGDQEHTTFTPGFFPRIQVRTKPI